MILLNIQFWEQDRPQAMRLAKLIADLEPVPRKDVGVLFTARFDCKHDVEAEKYVAQKFPCFKLTCRRPATGWPNGPNQMMGESYQHVVESVRSKVLPNNIECILFVEADCVPLAKDWISTLYNEWKASGKMVSGAWLKAADAGMEHVNGNCIIALDFWKKDKRIFHPNHKGGWDATLAMSILPQAHPSRYIWSDYQLGQAHNPWKGCSFLWEAKKYGAPDNVYYGQELFPVWFHGIKVGDAIECVRDRLL